MEIVRLQEELDAANRKLRNRDDLSEGRDWTWHDTPEQIAAAMLRLYPDKAKRLGSALQNAAKSTTRKPRTPVRSNATTAKPLSRDSAFRNSAEKKPERANAPAFIASKLAVTPVGPTSSAACLPSSRAR
jgi:hypothetical protein